MSGESVSDYKEVTDSEKTTIANNDAQWKAPSEDFIAEAEAVGAVYNSATGYFEMNTLVDITEEEMKNIINFGRSTFVTPGECNRRIRTNWTATNADAVNSVADVRYSFQQVPNLEVINLRYKSRFTVNPTSVVYFGFKCPKLKKVLGWLRMEKFNYNTQAPSQYCLFAESTNLEELSLYQVHGNLLLSTLKSLNLASLQFMVANASNTSPITITLHADAYARITDELFAQAAEKQITFSTPS